MAAPGTTTRDLMDAAITGVRITVSHILDKEEYAHLAMNATEDNMGLADYFQRLMRKAISADIARTVAARRASGARPAPTEPPAHIPTLKVEPVGKPAKKKPEPAKKAAPKAKKAAAKKATQKPGKKKAPAKKAGMKTRR